MHVKDVVGDPAAWAKLAVEKFGADMVTMHLISVDPLLKDASPKDACKTIEKVLQAVDVPLVIGGCGDPVKDTALFEEVCAQFPGERFLMSSVTRDMDVEKCAKFIKKAGHAILAFTPMDLNFARELNRRLFDYVSREDIVMDLTTAALGYGLDYAFTNMERARIGGLMGDLELAQPMSSGTTNAWAAREAWLKMSAEWEPRELRGPLWEVTTALTLLTAGVDLFMMMHPAAVKTLKDVTNYMTANKKADPAKFLDWIKVKA
jgi:acetyl-CoA decarbonylase/synthase complex subunit delta